MRIRDEYKHLIIGSKVGCGIQGEAPLEELASICDPILVLDESLSYYAPRFGPRMWLRIVHDRDNWKDPAAYAQHCAIRMQSAYAYGCRNLITGNEQIALEGLGDQPEDYAWLNTWGCLHVAALRVELRARGCSGVRIWGPALSPGHGEDDRFEGYRLLADYLRALDGIAVHNYWEPTRGSIGQPDAEWYSQRIERAHRLVEGELGIRLPWAVTEWNRPVRRDDSYDIGRYYNECREYYEWINSLDYVVAAFTFLAYRRDPAFADFTWADMPGMIDLMQMGWDRLSEGEWGGEEEPMPETLHTYADWAQARLQNGEDPRDTLAFVAHLQAIGADWRLPHLYGLPFVSVVPEG